MATFTLKREVAAPIDLVFEVLTDHRAYSKLTPLRSSTLEREGDPAPNGVGAVRVLKLAGPPIREEVTEFDAPSRFAYKLLSGAPVRSHTGTVDLAATGTGTSLTWVVDSTPSIPVPGAVWAALLRPAIRQLLSGVVKECERRARGGALRPAS
jgi:uncharacterized protein YndB with AHSA1/START domain